MHWMQFSVKDSGCGIRKENLEKIFRPFEQEGSKTAKTYGGTGLGLAISRRLAELMGGRITVESRPRGRQSVYGGNPFPGSGGVRGCPSGRTA